MKKEEVIKLIGEENWEKFIQWMKGQTCGKYPDNSTNYYKRDVEAFLKLLKTGYDRQKDPLAWD